MSSLVVIALVVALFLFLSTFYTVKQQTAVLIERFGKFNRVSQAGLHFKIPVVEALRGPLSLRVQQLDVTVETKTEDNVFVKVIVAVQYHVLNNKIFDAFYRLDQPQQQITAFVFDVVRARVPKMKLDDVFEKKEEIAIAVKDELSEIISNLGFGIIKTLVTDIDPDAKVKQAMNEINEAQRLQIAAQARGEADKILKVKRAEAEAESAALQGEGMARQRQAIIDGLRTSVAEFQKSVAGVGSQDVMMMVLMTQYFDTLKSLGEQDGINAILLPHSPTAVSDMATQLRDAIITAQQVSSVEKGK
jgi:regulator of protease activity HflC (stomatin/prohibitin superfamily)